jgi:hypothetical protein
MKIKALHSFARLTALILCFHTVAAFSLEGETSMAMTLKTSAFEHQNAIPKQFTCDGSNVSPALTWSNVPQNAKSLALIVEDPDVPAPFLPVMTWVHWVLYNIPPTVSELPQDVASKDLPKGTLEGKNDWRDNGYNGPCPPFGNHRYLFKLFALDTTLPDLNQPNKSALEKAMKGHIVAQTELMGTYKR